MNFFQSQRIMDSYTNSYTSMGYRVDTATPDRVVLISGRPVRHWLHFLATMLTMGLWLCVWIPLMIWGGQRMVIVSIDHHANAIHVVKKRIP